MNGSPSAQALYESAKANHLQGRAGEAERLYRQVLSADPDHVEALHGLGVLCLQSGRLDAAIEQLRKAVAHAAGSAALHNNLGVALCAAKRFEEAAEVYREAVAAEPDSLQSLTNLGYVLNLLGRSGEALPVLQKAVALKPDSADANNHLGIALLELGRPDEAVAPLERAIARDPRRLETYNDLGSVLLKCGRFEEAAGRFRQALALRGDSARALCGLADALGGLDRHDEAAACLSRALVLAPNAAVIHHNYGTALTFLGRMDDAGRAFERAATLAPQVPSYHYAAMALKKTEADDPHLKTLEDMAQNADGLPEREQAELHLALAKAYDDLERYDGAFAHLELGNTIKRRLIVYDEEKETGVLRAMAEAFTPELLAAHAGQGDPSDVPVFVVGMPRSGTTLVEQMLASHPEVFGADEQLILPGLVAAGEAGADFPSSVAALSGDAWRHLGESYGTRLHALAPQAKRITDKRPGNFVYVGLIHLALPRARLIHVQRDPLDTCFSCYSKLFGHNLPYTYDLGELGRYYRAYDALMAHWRRVLPDGAMLEVQYEDLVANFEAQARRLVAYCGLAWSDSCLDFHKTKRSVRTASAVQVRRPLYGTSVGRWRSYASHLGPLMEALGLRQDAP